MDSHIATTQKKGMGITYRESHHSTYDQIAAFIVRCDSIEQYKPTRLK